MALIRNRRAIGTFPTRREAENALHELGRSGFPMDKVSVIAKDTTHADQALHPDVKKEHVGNKADDGAKAGAVSGGALGGLAGLLVGLGVLAIPGLGPVMLAGAGATVLATALSGTAIGAAAGGLVGALIGLGIPEEEAKLYSDRVSSGHYLVMVEGSDTEIQHAERILQHHTIRDWNVYDVRDDAPTRAASATAPTNQTVDTVRSSATSVTNQASVPLYEEQLRTTTTRHKTGEAILNKHVETETVRAEVPVEKERIVIEHVGSPELGQPVVANETDFREGEVAHVDLFEETPDIQKQTFVREEVNLRKEVDRKVVSADETVRREKLDLDVKGNPRVDEVGDLPSDRV